MSFISFSDVPIQDYLDGTGVNSHDDSTNILMADKVTVTISTFKNSDRERTFTVINDKKLSQRVVNERRDRQLNQSDGLFIAFAWILKPTFFLYALSGGCFFGYYIAFKQ
jgi:hypothetical protein